MTSTWDGLEELPSTPGVYFLLGPVRELLYVGKATWLDRRVADHIRSAERGERPALYGHVREVRFEATASAAEAERREADLVTALTPAHNRALVSEGRWNFVVIEDLGGDLVRLSLAAESAPGAASVFGCFPHLGRGVASAAGRACSDGYAAMLRLLWAASPAAGHMPSAITRAAPEAFEVAVGRRHRRALAELLEGRSARLLDALATAHEHREPHVRRGLAGDPAAAAGFYAEGPRVLDAFRERHGLDRRPVRRAEIEQLLAAEVRAAIGPFRRAEPRRVDPRRQPQRR